MKIITIANLKGGVGKSLISFNLAGYLYNLKKRVLIIDLDAQANATRNMTLIENRDNPSYDKTIIDVLKSKKNEFMEQAHPSQVIIKNPLKVYEGFDLLPSHKRLADVEMELQGKVGYNLKVKSWIEMFQKELKASYDYIFFDVGPYMAVGTVNALSASDEIFLITDSSANALDGAWNLFDQWTEICDTTGLVFQIKGVIANNINDNQSSSKDLIKALRDSKGLTDVPIYNNYVKNSVKIKDSENEGPVALSPFSKVRNNVGVQSLFALIEEIRKEGYL